MRLSAFRGKLLILDFWATWCAPCREMVPVMDSLQRVFGERVVFLPVTYQSAGEVAPVLAAMRRLRPFSLPEVTGDKVLHALFPHRSLPHYVWIDGSGVLRAVTEEKEVTGENIRKFLGDAAGTGPLLALKRDVPVAYDKSRPLFAAGGADSVLRYHSVLSGYVPGLKAGMDIVAAEGKNKTGGGLRANVRNVPLTWLLRMAWSDSSRWFSGARLRLLSRDSALMTTRLTGGAYEDWLREHGWTYELLVPGELAGRAYPMMREDVGRLFPQYRVGVERVRTRCLVLVRTSAEDKLRSAGGEPLVEVGPFGCRLRNTRLGQLVKRLEVQYLSDGPLPLVDGTGYTGAVDLALEAPMNDVKALNAALSRYDLQLVERDWETELLVVRDNFSNPKS